VFEIGVVHEVFFEEIFKMGHIPGVGDYYKIIGAGNILALQHLLALLHRFHLF
jgi:hypothetical protein